MLLLLGLGVVAAIVLRLMTVGERQRLLDRAESILRLVIEVARRRRPELELFRDALRTRTPIAVMTPVVLLAGLAMFAFTRFGAGAPGGSAALNSLYWGGSFGPRTTNGEWWRLATSMLIHPTTFLLVVNALALVTVAPLVERYAGTVAFIVVYCMAGLIASVVNLWWYPVAVSGAASGPIFGLYGLMLSSLLWNRFHRRSEPAQPDDTPSEPAAVVIPMSAIIRTLPAAVAFVACNMMIDDLAADAQLAAFGVGFVGGLVITRRSSLEKPSVRRTSLVAVIACAVVLALAFPVRGIADVKPEIERVVTLEDRTAGAYQATYERYKHGQVSAEALAQQIDRTILPDLQEAVDRLKALERVPQEHQRFVADAEEYLHLRIKSWQLRAQALRRTGRIPERDGRVTGISADADWRMRAEAQYRTDLAISGRSEGAERASLEALRRLRP
jgi:membrane associated rhomboid family serine protease